MSDGLTCEEQFLVCKAAAEYWLAGANSNTWSLSPLIGAAQRATNGLIYDSMILGCQLAEAVCISNRVTVTVAKAIAPVIDTIVYVLGAIVIIAGIAYLVVSLAPLALVAVVVF